MPPEISKLVAAITELVSALGDSSGLPSDLPSSIGATSVSDDRFTASKERVAAGRGLLVRFSEPESGDRSWNKIANIFADSFAKKFKGPDFDLESEKERVGLVPTIIENVAPSLADKEEEKSIFEKILEFLGPVLLIVGGIGTAIAAIFEGPGVVGDVFRLISKGALEYGRKFLAEIGNKLIESGSKFIGSIDELIQGGLKLIGLGDGKLASLLKGIAGKIGGGLLKAAKFLPFVGSGVAFYFAYQRFNQGDYIGSTMEIASGILNLIPGAGWIASAIIDVASLVRDAKMTEEERVESNTGFISNMLTGIKAWFKQNGMAILRGLPFTGSLIYLWEAYNEGFSSKEGIIKLITAFAGVVGAGPILEPAINFLFSIFDEKDESETSIGAPTGKSFFQTVKEFVIKSVNKLPIWLRKPLEWLGFVKETPASDLEIIDTSTIGQAKDMAKGVLEKTKEFGSSIKDWFTSNIPAAKDMAKGVLDKTKEFGGVISDWYSGTFEKIKESGSSLYEKMQSGLNTAFDSIIKAISSIPENIQRITRMISTLLMPIFDSINVVREKISPIIDKILDWSPLRLFERDNLSNTPAIDIQIANDAIRVESNVLVEIAQHSKNQTILLQKIIEKMDGINIGTGPSLPAPSQNNIIPGMGKSSSITSNLSKEALLPIDTVGGLA